MATPVKNPRGRHICLDFQACALFCFRARTRVFFSRPHSDKKAVISPLIGTKKGALFSLIYFFDLLCIYFIPHNYAIPQAMPHAIPQTHSSFYPRRIETNVNVFRLKITL